MENEIDNELEINRLKAELQESENKIAAIINTAVDGIITIDNKGFIETMNPAASRLFGYQQDELVGQKVNVLMTEVDRKGHDGYMEKYHRTGEKKIIGIGRDVIGKRKNGTEFPFALSVSEVQLSNRVIYTGIIHDISRRKADEERLKEYAQEQERNLQEIKKLNAELESRVNARTKELENKNLLLNQQIQERLNAEKALIESQKLYITIAKNFPNGVITIFDRQFRYMFIDGKELGIFDELPEHYLGKTIFDKLPEETANQMAHHLEQCFQGGNISFEIQLGDNFYLITSAPLFFKENKVLQVMAVSQNITDRKKAEDEIKKSLARERELSDLKSKFVSMASHEFRTPLGTILSSIALVAKYNDEKDMDKKMKHINRVKANVEYLTQVLNDFLSLGKFDEGKVVNQPDWFDLNAFCMELNEEMEAIAKPNQHISFSNLLKGNHIMADKKLLKPALANLLSNAIKYSEEGKEIQLILEETNSEITIQVKDQGIGIPEQDQVHLFELFYRAHNTTNIQGT
ncbi:MAG: PAS domain S-box protein, partial [Cytophagales bacterium]|nr:PAS domain S-box protein [Cytophagales bacterium]